MVDIKKFLSKTSDEESQYFWSLIVEPAWVSAGIWRIEEGKAQVVATGNPVGWGLDEELVNAADSTLSSAIQGFPDESKEPSKTVFGVSSSWVKQGEIKEEYLAKIKKICDELSLTPIGFVVLPEAIAHLIKSEEGSPINAIVAGLYKETIEISVFKLGNLAGTTEVARSVALVDDVVEGLSRFSGSEPIPSRFLIYNGREGELDEARQSLLKANWDDYENLKFLHTPKMETIDSKRKIYAVCLAGASELAKATSVEGEVDEKRQEQKVGGEAVQEEIKESEVSKVDSSQLGFVAERDIAEVLQEAPVDQEVETPTEEHLQNVTPYERPKTEPKPISKSHFSNLTARIKSFLLILSGLKGIFSLSGKKPLLFGIVFLILFMLTSFSFWWFYPKAQVTIYVSPKKLEERIGLTIDTTTDSLESNQNVLIGKRVSTQISGEKTKNTTGIKTVGEKARGEVTIYRVGPSISLTSGTILYGPENLKFTLDEDITLASGSAGSPGTIATSLTAQDIGAQYNMASGTSFSIGNYATSDMEGKNESAFSGGSSREINAVSSEDQKVLQEDLQKELSERAQRNLSEQLTKDELFIESSVTATPSATNFSHKVGDEASNLKLSLSLEVKGVAVEKAKLFALAQEVLKDKVPQGFVLRQEQVGFDFDLDEESGGVYEFDVRISVNLLPEVKTDEIKQKIKGKYPAFAEEFLNREVPGFERAEIKLNPRLPGRLGTLPHLVKRIDVEVAAER